jgi:hypothetical protein
MAAPVIKVRRVEKAKGARAAARGRAEAKGRARAKAGAKAKHLPQSFAMILLLALCFAVGILLTFALVTEARK